MNDPLLRRKDDQLAALKRDLSPRDPMVHRGIGDAVKDDPVTYRFDAGQVVSTITEFGIGVPVGKCIRTSILDIGPSPALLARQEAHDNAYKAAKKKARSDRMKATWAAQRAAAVDVQLP